MTYISIVAPMGSGKTTLSQKLYRDLKKFDLVLNTEHEVFEWSCYKDRYEELAAQIQASMQENHFYQLFGTFLKDKNKNVITDSGFIEHAFYNNAKHAIGRYDDETHDFLARKHKRFNKLLLKKPDVTIFVNTSPQQVIENLKKRNRRGERERDMRKMLEYITELKRWYLTKEWDIIYDFDKDNYDEVLEKINE